jgi:rubredoxin
MKCKECGWMLEYIPRSFREQIEESIGGKKRKGYWKCPNCGFKKRRIGDIDDKNKKKENLS